MMGFTFDQWLSLAREFGVPIAILVPLTLSLMWFILKILSLIYNAGCWVGQEILIPMQKHHLNFLDTTQQTQLKQAETAEKTEATLHGIALAVQQHDEWERKRSEEIDKDVAIIRKDFDHLEIRVANVERKVP